MKRTLAAGSSSEEKDTKKVKSQPKIANQVPGLFLFENFITTEEEKQLSNTIDKQPWNNELSRRTQHYGYEYNYTSKSLEQEDSSNVLTTPELFKTLLEKIKEKCPNETKDLDFKQVIVNEYSQKQGISKHVDHCQAFGPVIVIVSLRETCVMKFHKLEAVDEDQLLKKQVKRKATGDVIDVVLPRRSLVLMTGDARYQFQHEIPKTVNFKIDSDKILDIQKKQFTSSIKRGELYRRVSITFRSINGL